MSEPRLLLRMARGLVSSRAKPVAYRKKKKNSQRINMALPESITPHTCQPHMAGNGMTKSTTPPSRYGPLTFADILTRNASSGDTDVNLRSPSPKLHPSAPCLGDIHSSPELAESTSYAESPTLPLTEIHTDIRSKASEIDVNSAPAAPECDSSRDGDAGAAASTVAAGVNDVFCEQFLTDTPGSSDTQEVQSERRDANDRRSEGKMGERGNIWWSRKNVDHLAEKMGHLTSAEKT